LIPHTHDDVGWLKTIDEYFTGTRPDIQRVHVEAIIDNVIEELQRDKSRTFVYNEIKYFSLWWAL
jgi:hypothetical protein